MTKCAEGSSTPNARRSLIGGGASHDLSDDAQLSLARGVTDHAEFLLEASQFIATLENRQGLKVACLEEIAFRQKWIDAAALEKLALPLIKSGYGQYLLRVLTETVF